MSKKTREKTRKTSPKAVSGKAARAQSMASAKTPAAKSRRLTANKSGKNANKQPEKVTSEALHKAPSKQLKSSGPKKSALRAAAGSKTAVAAAEAGNPHARKPAEAKVDASAPRKPALAEGTKAPAFRLPRDGGDTVSLTDYSGRKLVLFFYPRADTPGCTKEAIDFTRLANAFAESQTAILGVSADPPKTQEAFRNKHRLSVPLASDEMHEMLDAYGVWGEKNICMARLSKAFFAQQF